MQNCLAWILFFKIISYIITFNIARNIIEYIFHSRIGNTMQGMIHQIYLLAENGNSQKLPLTEEARPILQPPK